MPKFTPRFNPNQIGDGHHNNPPRPQTPGTHPVSHNAGTPDGPSPAHVLAPFIHLGVLLTERPGTNHAYGECPFCGKAGNKFSVSTESTSWDCKVCGQMGNQFTFIRRFYDLALQTTTDDQAEELAAERGLAPWVLADWGLCVSPLTGEWLVPGYGPDGKLDQLYRYADFRTPTGTVKRLIPTPGLWKDGNVHRLFGIPNVLRNRRATTIYVCEGPWDGMALHQSLTMLKEVDGELHATGSPRASMAGKIGVVATPGANVFLESWLPVLNGKKVVVCFDNDHPRRNPQGAQVPGAGLAGARRVTGVLRSAGIDPLILFWGKRNTPPQQYDLGLPSGYDVRDLIASHGTAKAVTWLRSSTCQAPPEWISLSQKKVKKLDPSECDSWRKLLPTWKRAMEWTEGLERGLAFSLAIALSTESVGSQLWGILMGPPSTGKTTIAEALAVARSHVKAVSTLTGLHSGYKSDKEGKEDHSLIVQIQGKTLIVKDADTLMKNPNCWDILAQLRDLYDGSTRAFYRHGVNREYEDQRCTILLCGTGSLRVLDSSELGARFLICSVMRGIDHDLEWVVGLQAARRASRNVKTVSNGKAESKIDPDMAEAKKLTGGYVMYLRKNARALLDQVNMSEDDVKLCVKLGQFVSYMRARKSKHQDEVVEREFSPRLIEQHVRLMSCLCAVMNKAEPDDYIRDMVRQVAIDTSQGNSMMLASYMHRIGRMVGVPEKSLATWMGMTPAKMTEMLGYLRKVEVVERFRYSGRGMRDQYRWRLTRRVAELYEYVTGEVGGDDDAVDYAPEPETHD